MAEVLLVRSGNGLFPAEPLSEEVVEGLAHGEMIRCTLSRPRNVRHHRKFFALLGVVWKAQSFYATPEGLLNDMKIATGHCTQEPSLTDPSGFRTVPSSISFAQMDQTNFDAFYKKAVEFILRKVLPLADSEDIDREVNAILDSQRTKRIN